MIGLISDTHEQDEPILKALEIFRQKNVEFIVHCGDIISPGVLADFKGHRMKIIFGNNDGEKIGLNNKAEELGFEKITETKEFLHKNKLFYVCHGSDKKVLNDAINSQKYDYILTGHTHVVRDEKIGKTRIINPGTLFRAKKTAATLDTKNDKLELIEIK